MLVANIPSYMGGVDLWQNEGENPENFDPQSIHDKMLEVVSITGAWHLGTLQVSDDSSETFEGRSKWWRLKERITKLHLGWTFSGTEDRPRSVNQDTNVCSFPCPSGWRTLGPAALHA